MSENGTVAQKHIYFIRHGQTLKNATSIHQGPDEPLTKEGEIQARAVGLFLRKRGIDALVSSPFTRALQTAETITQELELPYSIEPSVREFGRPLSLYGRHHYSLASLRYIFDLYRHRLDLLWSNEGAENLVHIRERVRDARVMLEETPGAHIAVVSHRIFMSMFAETVCYDKPLSLLKFVHGLLGDQSIPNTGILHFTCTQRTNHITCNWVLEEVLLPPYRKDI